MYKKAMSLLMAGSLIWVSAFACVREMDMVLIASQPVTLLKLELEALERREAENCGIAASNQESVGLGIAEVAVSGQRVVDFQIVEQKPVYELEDADMEVLLRIVEAEAGGEDEDGKLLVANVVLNRVDSGEFPDTVTEVVFQKENGVTQFSPVADGSYEKAQISEETIEAVGRALMGEDISEGALYFTARKYADSQKMQWFDDNLTFLFCHGGHEFFK
jgi:hypothetical protein